MSTERIDLLHTEQRNPDTIGIDQMNTFDMLQKINEEDQKVALRVREALPQIARAIDLIVPRMKRGGRMVYVGAGTSGRLGYMDAAECAPTYGMAQDAVSCVMAGGHDAVFCAKETIEDESQSAVRDLQAWGLTPDDTVIAAAASGRTPYCIGALDYARSIGAGAVSISCNPNAIMSQHAQVAIEVDTGCEAIMGSTRMKAGSAQKMIMNMLSTCVMIRLGRTCDNLMVCLKAKNGKLNNRVLRLFGEATGCEDKELAAQFLEMADGRLVHALLMYKSGCTLEQAEKVFAATGSFPESLEKLSR